MRFISSVAGVYGFNNCSGFVFLFLGGGEEDVVQYQPVAG
jgi:hypothetical protein